MPHASDIRQARCLAIASIMPRATGFGDWCKIHAHFTRAFIARMSCGLSL